MGQESAKITDRFLAYLIDTIPFGVGYYASLYLLIVRWGYLPKVPRSGMEMLWLWIGLYVIYHAVFNSIGGSIGKRILGICVVGSDGEALSLGRSFVRAMGLLVSTPFFNLGFLWAFVNSDSRTWHDLLAGSWVVEKRAKTEVESTANALIAFVVLLAIVGVSFWLYVFRPGPADATAIQKANAGLKILAQIEEKYKARHGTYTEQLMDLAVASDNPREFTDAMKDLFDSGHFSVFANKNKFRFRARAKDSRRTVVTLEGP